MTVSVSAFRIKFPAFASTITYPDTIVEDRLEEAIDQVNLDWFGTRADKATYYLTAHLLVFNGGGVGVSGAPVSSVTAGSASITYAVGSVVTGDPLMATSYGREYMRLMRLCGPAATTVWQGC